jgi:hypothetical protein
MKWKDLLNIDIDDVYWTLLWGIPKRKTDFVSLRYSGFKGLHEPVFFLSTGRTGTLWLTKLLKKDPRVKVLHHPNPDLAVQSKLAYEAAIREDFTYSPFAKQSLKEIYFTAREQFLRYSYKCNKRMIETNSNITFFAPILNEIFPNSKFIHIYRHPGDFVRSGIRRNYYTGKSNLDYKRLYPLKGPFAQNWDQISQVEKIGWLWYETNRFVEIFKQMINQNRVFNLNFNHAIEQMPQLIDFIEIKIPSRQLRHIKKKKFNVQRTGYFPEYQAWNEKDREKLRAICGELARKYGYQL